MHHGGSIRQQPRIPESLLAAATPVASAPGTYRRSVNAGVSDGGHSPHEARGQPRTWDQGAESWGHVGHLRTTRLQEEGAVSKATDPGPDRCSPGPAAPVWTSEAAWWLGPVTRQLGHLGQCGLCPVLVRGHRQMTAAECTGREPGTHAWDSPTSPGLCTQGAAPAVSPRPAGRKGQARPEPGSLHLPRAASSAGTQATRGHRVPATEAISSSPTSLSTCFLPSFEICQPLRSSSGATGHSERTEFLWLARACFSTALWGRKRGEWPLRTCAARPFCLVTASSTSTVPGAFSVLCVGLPVSGLGEERAPCAVGPAPREVWVRRHLHSRGSHRLEHREEQS